MKTTTKLGLKMPESNETFDISHMNDNMTILDNQIKLWDEIWKKIYPIGSLYISVNNTNPKDLFGGTWVAWGSGRVPVGVNTGDTNFSTVEKTGGATTHTLTAEQMPAHEGHLYSNAGAATGGTAKLYLSRNTMGTYGSTGRGWVDHNGGEMHPAGFTRGSGDAHNNLQPYITCYMWKRTA